MTEYTVMDGNQNLFVGVDVDLLSGFYQKPVARIDILDETIFYTRYDGEGREVTSHELDPAVLATAFAGLPLSTGLLPNGCLFYSRHEGQERLAIYLPPRVRPLRVQAGGERRRLDVPLPGLVFWGTGQRYAVAAAKQWPGAPGERLFYAPLPNVYPGGRICTGSVEFPTCAAQTIATAAKTFLESDFSSHLAGGKSSRHGDDILLLWQELADAGAEEYPLDDLRCERWTIGQVADGGPDV